MRRSGFFEMEGVSVGVDVYGVAFGEVAGEDFFGEGVFQFSLDGALQGTGAVGGIVAFVHEQILGGVAHFQFNLTLGEAVSEVTQLDFDDLT